MSLSGPSAPGTQLTRRYDGVAKVTGTARYSAEFTEPFARGELAYAFLVQSTIASGTIDYIDRWEAQHSPGVILVLTPTNAPKLQVGENLPRGTRGLSLLQDAEVHYNGQPIALVIARSLPEARQAARLLRVKYTERQPLLNFLGRLDEGRPPRQGPRRGGASPNRGDVERECARAAATVDQTYITPIQNHNPMEPHATIAWWEGAKLNVYDSTQNISAVQSTLAQLFGLEPEGVRVRCPYTGGGFGSKGAAWSHVPLAAMAAQILQRPVKLVLDRNQMFGPVGARPTTVNRIRLAAAADGRLLAIQHHATMHASVLDDFVESVLDPSRMLYSSDANLTSQEMVDMNLGVATYMRAPGKSTGTAVLEIAMDELAEKLNMDPLQLRLVNYAERDPTDGRPWSSKHLKECYAEAAERFGWQTRSTAPRLRMEGNHWIGYGMATATYPGHRAAASATVTLLSDGSALAVSGTHDLGTGMYTIMAQTAGAALGLQPSKVQVKLGDTTLPKAPGASSSQSTASVCPAVHEAALQVRRKLIELAVTDPRSPLHGAPGSELVTADGRIFYTTEPSRGESYAEVLQRYSGPPLEATALAKPGEDSESRSVHSFGAVFAEVAVDRDTCMVQVRRVVATFDIGRLLNQTTGMNQLRGGIVWGVGFALMEESVIDNHCGRTVNESLAEYHVPVQRDVGVVDVSVLNIPDTDFNPLGVRGVGEIGNTGTAAAIANAIYNATGKRVREYPITPDKIMRA